MVNSSFGSATDASFDLKLKVFVILALAGVFGFGIGVLTRPDKSDITPNRRVNPNVASREILAELPGIGPTRALAIIECRENSKRPSGKKVFEKIEDLENVHGIGKISARKLEEYFKFE